MPLTFLGEIEFEWTLQSFLENPEKFIQEMDTCTGSIKKGKEQFILQGILPYLEKYMWSKSSANNIDTYRVLAQASCCRSGNVVKHSLQQLLHFLYRDGLENYKQNLLSVEEIIRLSIVPPDGMLRKEAGPTRVLRLSVYGRILSEQVVHKFQAGFSRIDLKDDLERLAEVKDYFKQIIPSLKKEDILRYSMEFIQEAVSYLLPRSPTTDLGCYLEECEAFCANSQTAIKKFLLFRRLRYSEVKWFDLHCVLHYLHGKVGGFCLGYIYSYACNLYRGYNAVAIRYEFYVRVGQTIETISQERAKRTSEILFLPRDKYYRTESTAKTSKKSNMNFCSLAPEISSISLVIFHFVRNSLSSFKSFEVSFFLPALSSSSLNDFMSALVN